MQTAIHQVQSAEVWGAAARYGDLPGVEACVGQLPTRDMGIEFETSIDPSERANRLVQWYCGDAMAMDVAGRAEYVKIAVVMRKVVYRNMRTMCNVECIFPI